MHAKYQYISAILWVLLSTFVWTLVFAAGKFADGSIGVFQITLFRYIGALLVLIILLPGQGGLVAHRSKQSWVHLARSLSGCGGAVAITWASANMPLVDATSIGLLYGVLATLLGATFLKEVISGQRLLAIGICLSGVGIVMFNKGAFRDGISILPALATFSSATLFAIEGVLISMLGRSERAFTVMLYVTFFGLLLMLIPAMVVWRPVSWSVVLMCVLLGPLGIIGQYCTIRGYRSAPLSVVAPIDYSWLLFSAFLGVVVFDEIPDAVTWAGCAVILLGGVLLAYPDKQA